MFISFFIVGFFGVHEPARAADNVCVNLINQSDCMAQGAYCFYYNKRCYSKTDTSVCNMLTKTYCENAGVGSTVCKWDTGTSQCFDRVRGYIQQNYQKPSDYIGFMPDCAFTGLCRNTNDLVSVFLLYGNGMFFIVAGYAFVMFVYGGFMMIFAMGNQEKVKKGQQILVAAVIGLIIVFSSYIVIKFLLEALGVKDSFNGVK
jgi:hypothetical protein